MAKEKELLNTYFSTALARQGRGLAHASTPPAKEKKERYKQKALGLGAWGSSSAGEPLGRERSGTMFIEPPVWWSVELRPCMIVEY